MSVCSGAHQASSCASHRPPGLQQLPGPWAGVALLREMLMHQFFLKRFWLHGRKLKKKKSPPPQQGRGRTQDGKCVGCDKGREIS